VFLLRALLAAAQPLGWRGRTEIRGAVAAAAGTARPRATEASAAAKAPAAAKAAAPRTWAAKPTTATRTRPAEAAARTRAAISAARWSRAWRTIFPCARFTDRKIAPHEGLRVELLDDFFGDAALSELDERKPARTSSFAIDRHHNVSRFGDRCEVSSEICFGRAVGEVPYEETDSQLCLGETDRFYLRLVANAE
jgi:hypothetical protein